MSLEIAIPLRIGLMPVTLKVGAEFSFRPIVHTGSSQICFVATYSGETGFEYSGGSLKNTSDMSNRTVNTCPDQETVAAGTLTVAMGATGKFPTVSLQVFGEFLVPSATFQLDGVVSYEPGIASAMRACQAGSATLSSIIEIKMSLLGASLSRQAKLWETKKEWTCDKQLVVTKFDHTTGETTTRSDL